MKKAIYPGSFDPVTLGHIDIVERASKKCDKLYVVLMENDAKVYTFDVKEREDMLKKTLAHLSNVEVLVGHGLTVDFAKSLGADTIIRGLRAVSDFEYELQQSTMNMSLEPGIETVFFMAKPEYSFLSSSAAKTIAANGGDLTPFVPEYVKEQLEKKYQ